MPKGIPLLANLLFAKPSTKALKRANHEMVITAPKEELMRAAMALLRSVPQKTNPLV